MEVLDRFHQSRDSLLNLEVVISSSLLDSGVNWGINFESEGL